MSRDILLEVLKLVVMLVSVLVTSYVIPWIKANTDSKKLQTVFDWVEQGVHAAEQMYGAKTGTQKKRCVTEFLQKIIKAKKINISDQELEMMIEAAVQVMNTQDFITVSPEEYNAAVGEAATE